MKILIWIIVALVIIGGLAWFFSSGTKESGSLDVQEQQNNVDISSENSRVIGTDTQVFDEIDDALAGLE